MKGNKIYSPKYLNLFMVAQLIQFSLKAENINFKWFTFQIIENNKICILLKYPTLVKWKQLMFLKVFNLHYHNLAKAFIGK